MQTLQLQTVLTVSAKYCGSEATVDRENYLWATLIEVFRDFAQL